MKNLLWLLAILIIPFAAAELTGTGPVCASVIDGCVQGAYTDQASCEAAYDQSKWFDDPTSTEAVQACAQGCCTMPDETQFPDMYNYSCTNQGGEFSLGACEETQPDTCGGQALQEGEICCDNQPYEGSTCPDDDPDPDVDDEYCTEGDDCAQEQACTGDDAPAFSEFTAGHLSGEPVAQLSWAFDRPECQAEITDLTVGWGVDEAAPSTTVEPTTNTFTTGELNPGQTYTIKIQATFAQVGQDTVVNATTQFVVGDTECFLGPRKYCLDRTTPVSCDSTNKNTADACTTGEGAQEVCTIYTDAYDETKVTCAPEAVCEKCNLGYENFGELLGNQETFNITIDGQQQEVACKNPTYQTTVDGEERDYAFCHLDYSKGSLQEYQRCADVNSCTQYSTQQSCGENNCRISPDCEWNSGADVCVSQDEDIVECNIEGINEEQCQAIDPACEYYEDTCYNQEEGLVCEVYQTAEACVGATGDFDILPGTNVPSNNASNEFNLTKCMWHPTAGCVKDSDADDQIDPMSPDFTNPETEIITDTDQLFGEDVVLRYTASDDASGIRRTYARLYEEQACADVPDEPFEDTSIVSEERGTFEALLSTGTHCIRYYSKDQADNLEHIKKQEIQVDATQLEASYRYELSVDYETNTTNARFWLDLNQQAYCTMSHEDQSHSGTSSRFSHEFTGLEEGKAVFDFSCEARNGDWQDSTTLILDFDARITNPVPKLDKPGYRSSNISRVGVYATNATACSYLEDGSWQSMQRTEDTQEYTNEVLGETNTYTFFEADDHPLRTGYYEHQVRCSFTDGSTYTGGPADSIEFAIDDEAPYTTVTYGNESESRPQEIVAPYTGLDVNFICTDPAITDSDNESYESGVREIRDGNQSFAPGNRNVVPGDNFSLSCIDANGNEEETYYLSIVNQEGNSTQPNGTECPVSVCSNGELDAQCGETDVDCGGTICGSTCEVNQTCDDAFDCTTSSCDLDNDSVCVQATCSDGIRNGQETGQDCGGPECDACAQETNCEVDADCETGICRDNVCKTSRAPDPPNEPGTPGGNGPGDPPDGEEPFGETPGQEGGGWAALLLIILGSLAILGGGGYIYWEHEHEDAQAGARPRGSSSDLRGDALEHTPQTDFADSALREEARNERVKKRRSDRDELLGAFEDTDEPEELAEESEPEQPETEEEPEEPDEPEADEEPDKKHAKKASDDDKDVFDELEEMAK